MAAVSSTYKNPSTSFVWWIEGDRIAIATDIGDGGTSETAETKLKPVQLSIQNSLQTDGSTKNLVAEPVDATETVIDVDDGSVFSAFDLIQINNEIMRIESITDNALTVTRGFRDTTATTHATSVTSLTTLGAAISDNSTASVTLSSVASLSVDDMIKVESEVLRVTAINTSTNVITVVRGRHSSTAASHSDGVAVSKFDDNGLIKEHNKITNGMVISYYAEPDKVTAIQGSGSTIDIDNVLQPLLIDYVKGKALMDAASREDNPGIAQIRMASAQQCLANYKEGLRKFGMKKNDKSGGTRGIVPANMR